LFSSQLLAAGTRIYEESDVGHNFFLVQSGLVVTRRSSSANRKERMDYISRLSDLLAERKSAFLGTGRHGKGAHFGEYCLALKTGLRLVDAEVAETAELYDISKADLWQIMLAMPIDLRCKLLADLFCTVGGEEHTPRVAMCDIEMSELFTLSSLSSLYKLSSAVIEEAVKRFKPVDEEGYIAGVDYSSLIQRRGSLGSLDSDNTKLSKSSKLKSSASQSRWTTALAKYHSITQSPSTSEKQQTSVKKLAAIVSNTERSTNTAGDDAETSAEPTILRDGTNDEDESVADSVGVADFERDLMDDIEDLVKQMFDKFDVDASGTIDREELMEALGELGMVLTWPEIDAMIAATTSSGSTDSVNRKEVVDAVVTEITVLHNRRISNAPPSDFVPKVLAVSTAVVAPTTLPPVRNHGRILLPTLQSFDITRDEDEEDEEEEE
jgi:hypothetical protein